MCERKKKTLNEENHPIAGRVNNLIIQIKDNFNSVLGVLKCVEKSRNNVYTHGNLPLEKKTP